MNLKEILAGLINKQKGLLDKAKNEGRIFTAEESGEFKSIQGEIENTIAMIAAQDQFNATSKEFNAPAPTAATPRIEVKNDRGADLPFANLAEQLKAIKNHAVAGSVDERLLKVQNATGASAGSGPDGGFAIQKDFAGSMVETAVKEDPILSLIDSYQVSAKSDRVSWTDLDESDISSTVFGGVQTYWAAEAATAAASKPKMSEKELKLEKLLGFYYNTNELEEDSTFNSQIVTRAFTASIRRNFAAAVVAGDGIGKPIGMLNAGSLVSVAKETNQAADTLVWENISKMYHRARGEKSKFVWLCHPDTHEQFDQLSLAVGTGGVPVYLQAAAAGTVDMLRGRPIIDSDHCSALGDKGDIYFVDPSQYMMIYKGGIKQDVSIHVAFLTAENCFRFIFRCNGMPKQNKTLTIKNSAKARSSIITLDARA